MSTKLLTTTDIAELLGVCRQHVTNRVTKRPDFPSRFTIAMQRSTAITLSGVPRTRSR